MPNIPILIEKNDVKLILAWLKEDSDIALINDCSVGDGKDRVCLLYTSDAADE